MHRDFPRRLHQLVDSGRSRFYGAVMFADVSSYTVYAESACTRGIAGVEGLADEMRRMFDDCRDTVTRHDGEIVSTTSATTPGPLRGPPPSATRFWPFGPRTNPETLRRR